MYTYVDCSIQFYIYMRPHTHTQIQHGCRCQRKVPRALTCGCLRYDLLFYLSKMGVESGIG